MSSHGYSYFFLKIVFKPSQLFDKWQIFICCKNDAPVLCRLFTENIYILALPNQSNSKIINFSGSYSIKKKLRTLNFHLRDTNFTNIDKLVNTKQYQGPIASPIRNGEIRHKNPSSTKQVSDFFSKSPEQSYSQAQTSSF